MFTDKEWDWITDQITHIVAAADRIADALDRAIPKPEPIHELTPDEQDEQAKLDEEFERQSTHYQETIAVVELLEQKGERVPNEVYKRLGIDPPKQAPPVAPDASVLEAPQPGSDAAAEIVSSRKPGV